MVGLAVKVILPPEQTDVELGVTDTDGVTELTVTLTNVLELSHPLTVWLT